MTKRTVEYRTAEGDRTAYRISYDPATWLTIQAMKGGELGGGVLIPVAHWAAIVMVLRQMGALPDAD
jgi:hypothetical protein